jgi:ABC-2 type transport system ATP-binding protein
MIRAEELRETGVANRVQSIAPAIEARDLVKMYPGGVRALDRLSFSVRPGTIFGLVGPNGAGKSTAVKILTTLSRPDSGIAKVAGLDVVREPARVRLAIGCVNQKSGVDSTATGRENLTLQGRVYGLQGKVLHDGVSALLERFGLAQAGDRVARTYSGGMQRKLDVAMGLIHHPQVLFLDEPTTGLDPEARADMWKEIGWLAKEEGITILLTTHYLEEADRLAQLLAIVDRGRVVAEGTPETLKSELRGDTIHMELAGPEDGERSREVLSGMRELREVEGEGRLVHARADRGAETVPQALAALESAGIKVASITVSRPSLEDVYLRYAGRAFHDADEAGANKRGRR